MGFVDDFKKVEERFRLKIREVYGSGVSEIVEATPEEDIQEHWDVNIKVDVKAVRKVRRHDNTTNENIHYVEFKNVNGDIGWLYGDANYFAFETDDYWIVVPKDKLKVFVENKCKDKIKCAKPTLYQIYSREDRKDKITMVKTLDLMFLADLIIDK